MHTQNALATDHWETLETTCTAAIELAGRIANQLHQGSPAHALTPLLHQAQSLATSVQAQIRQLTAQPVHPQAAAKRARVLTQMRQWLTLEEQNQQLCSRRGVALTGPRRRTRRAAPKPTATSRI